MKIEYLLKFRYVIIVCIIFLLVNSLVLICAGISECIQGYIGFIKIGFKSSDTIRPGVHLLEGLDYFVSSLVFMIFGLGLGQLFLLEDTTIELLPQKLKIKSLKELKVLLWETILIALVIFCVTHLLKTDVRSWELLSFPLLILILSIALFFMKSEGFGKNTSNSNNR